MINPGQKAGDGIIRGRFDRSICAPCAVLLVLMLAWPAIPRAADELEELAALWSIADEPYRPVTRELDTPPFVHRKVLTIDVRSLEDGWAGNHQCHANFPMFPSLQIAFREGAVRNMRITEQNAEQKAWVTASTIQMKDTRPDTRLCFTSENYVVTYDEWNDEYRVTVGPYYLRLFDGYFPLNVILTVEYPADVLRFVGLEPADVEGATVEHERGAVRFQSLFEGKLALVFRFTRA